MSTTTTNYGFVKPAITDTVATTIGTDLPATLDDIDTELKRVDDKVNLTDESTSTEYKIVVDDGIMYLEEV